MVGIARPCAGEYTRHAISVKGAPRPDGIDDVLEQSGSRLGRLRYVAAAARLFETPAFWAPPAVPLATHEPAWSG